VDKNRISSLLLLLLLLLHVATLPCETLMSAKQSINDKLQGSVTIHIEGVVRLLITKFKKKLRKVYL